MAAATDLPAGASAIARAGIRGRFVSWSHMRAIRSNSPLSREYIHPARSHHRRPRSARAAWPCAEWQKTEGWLGLRRCYVPLLYCATEDILVSFHPYMKMILVRWFILTLAVWAATQVVDGISCPSWKGLLAASLVLSLLNTFVKPLLNMLSLPFIVFTFGLFLLVINALLLKLTGLLVGSNFVVTGFWPAVWGSLVISIVSMVLGYPRQRGSLKIRRTDTISTGRRGPPPGKGPIIDV